MSLTMEVRGLEQLLARLGKVEDALRGPIADNALRAGALIVEADAKVRVPKVSGDLARSIHTEVSDGEARIGTDVVYARRIEYGFSGADSLGRRYNQAAQPYLRPALDANREAVLGAINGALRAQLERIGA